MAIEYNFTLDMDRSKRDNNIAYARTGDVDSVVINASLVLNGSPYTPAGTDAYFECITPNGHSVRTSASKTGSTVSAEIPPAAFQAAGVINVAYFRFETGGSDNPTYVESTEPFAIIVREGIGDNIDAGDYIEEWRQLADSLDEIVKETQQKAAQAEAAINEQKEEVDELKTQAQTAIAQDTVDVENAKNQAISNINSSQGAVDTAIDQLEEKTQEAVDAAQEALDGTLATDLKNAINRTLKLDVADMTNIPDNTSLSSLTAVGSYCCKTVAAAATISDSPVDDSPFNMYVFSSSTSGQVMQLVVPIDLQGKPTAEWHVRFGTSSAMDPWSVIGGGADIAAGLGIDVTGDAQKTVSLDTTAFYQHHEAADIIQGSTEVTGGGRIKELTVYGNTKQNLWVNPSGTSNGVTVTANGDGSITLSGTATAGTWILITVYNLKQSTRYTLSVDKAVQNESEAVAGFYVEEFDSADSNTSHVIANGQSSVSFTTKYDVKKASCAFLAFTGAVLTGTYRVMLNEGDTAEPWCPPGLNGVGELSIVTAGKNLVSTSESSASNFQLVDYFLPAGEYTLSIRDMPDGFKFNIRAPRGLGAGTFDDNVLANVSTSVSTFTLDYASPLYINGYLTPATPLQDIQLELGSTATPYEPPAYVTTSVDLDGHTLNALPDGTRDELRVDGTGAVTLVQRVGVATAPTDASGWKFVDGRGEFNIPDTSTSSQEDMTLRNMCDALPVRKAGSDPAYALIATSYGYAKHPSITDASTAASIAGGMTVLYPLATPQEIALPDIVIPDLASPDYTVYASSNVPAEIEAEVVKVDYLPAPDVYTKEEVDQKIEDAGGMPDIVPVSQGGTGVTTAAAERNRLGLGNTTGALPVANGGTGATTAKAAQNSLLNDMSVSSDTLTDSSMLVGYNASPSVSNGAVHKRSMSTIWDYIASKIRTIFGFDTSNVLDVEHGGTGATTADAERDRISVYSKAESDAKYLKVETGAGNIPDDIANGTVYIQYV